MGYPLRGVNIFSKFQVHISYNLGERVFWNFFRKRISLWFNYDAVCRTAPATPDQSIIRLVKLMDILQTTRQTTMIGPGSGRKWGGKLLSGLHMPVIVIKIKAFGLHIGLHVLNVTAYFLNVTVCILYIYIKHNLFSCPKYYWDLSIYLFICPKKAFIYYKYQIISYKLVCMN